MTDGGVWKARGVEIPLGQRSRMLGILNVTPDSFSDGGEHLALESAVAQAIAMLDAGADLVDVGGESTRPGFSPVSVDEEIGRVVPVIRELLQRRPDCILSIDTTKHEVADAALMAGVKVVNDVSGFQVDAELARVCAKFGAGVVLMRNGRDASTAGPILDRIRRSWERSVAIAEAAGVEPESIVVDPGVGFGTSRQEDLEILRGLAELRAWGFPMLLGTSRKRITGEPFGLALDQRLEPTLATTVAGIAAGVEFFRVHDVAENVRAAAMADLLFRGGELNE